MKERPFLSHDGKSRIEQFDCAEGTGERFDVGQAGPVRDATIRFSPDAWLEKLIDGAQRAKSTPSQRSHWLRLAEIALERAGANQPCACGGALS
jgi:hypothetical protein